jgi:hypothetical protein
MTGDCSWDLDPADPEADYMDEGCHAFSTGVFNSPNAPISDYTYGGASPTDAAFTRIDRILMLTNQTFVEVPTV